MNTIIFAITVNCSKIMAVMLKSFHKHHPNKKIHIVGRNEDFEALGDIKDHANNIFVSIDGNEELLDKFKQGHRGTTSVFAMVIKKMLGDFTHFIHIDSDIYFKKESISIIEKDFAEGYDIVGTRRCYGNNPSGIKGLGKYPDTISTFFFGMRIVSIPDYEFSKLCRYCEGADHPLGWMVLDAFDGVTHAAMQNGGKIKYLDQNEFGSQDIHGRKVNNYKSNMHMDMGSHIIHFGGVGSGYAYFSGKTKPEIGYGKWACGRYKLFCKLFYDENIEWNEECIYGQDGRWINGSYDKNILNILEEEMHN